jgi:hypothetical protein
MMNDCPDIYELGSDTASAHVSQCAACGDLVALAAGYDSLCDFTDDCAAVEPMLAIMAVRALDGDDRNRVDAHLADCARCFTTAAEAMLVAHRDVVSEPGSVAVPSVRAERPWLQRAAPAIATVVAIAACVVLLIVLRSTSDRSGETHDRRPAGGSDEQTHSVSPPPSPPPEPISLVVLLQGQERWMGNETVLPDTDFDQMQGAFVGVGPALEVLATMGPAGSEAALLTYDSKTTVRHPMADIATLGSAAGDQRDYRDKIGRALMAGLGEAHVLLAQRTGRKVLVVIGDGEGQQEDISTQLSMMIDQLRTDGIETYTLQHHAVTTDSPVGMQNMTRLGFAGDYRATSRDEFAMVAKRIVSSVDRAGRGAVGGTTGVEGRVLSSRVGDQETVITLDLGSDDGVAVGWHGIVTDERGARIRAGVEFTIEHVTVDEATARIKTRRVPPAGWLEGDHVRVWP